MRIRPVGTGDTDAVADVFLSALASMTYLPELYTDTETRAFIKDILLPNNEVWVADDAGEVIGFVGFGQNSIRHLWVRQDAQIVALGLLYSTWRKVAACPPRETGASVVRDSDPQAWNWIPPKVAAVSRLGLHSQAAIPHTGSTPPNAHGGFGRLLVTMGTVVTDSRRALEAGRRWRTTRSEEGRLVSPLQLF